jgi:hypothetical protein
MIQCGQHLCFALEEADPVRVMGEGGRQHFDGYVAPEFSVAGAINLAHAARTEQGKDPVVPDLPSHQGTVSDSRQSFPSATQMQTLSASV